MFSVLRHRGFAGRWMFETTVREPGEKKTKNHVRLVVKRVRKKKYTGQTKSKREIGRLGFIPLPRAHGGHDHTYIFLGV